MFKKTFILILILILGFPFYLYATGEWEKPLLSTTKADTPNVLFLQDCSGSMSCVIQATEKAGYLPNSKVPSGADFEYSYVASKNYRLRSGSRLNNSYYWGWGLLYTGLYGSGWYLIGYTADRHSIDASGNVAKRGPGYVWAYLNYHHYCMQWGLDWGGVNSAERRAGQPIYWEGSRYFDYESSRWNYIIWMLNYARIRHIGNKEIYDVRGHYYYGEHYVIDLPRANTEFNNDNRPGTPPFGTWRYDPRRYPPNKRMIPVTLDDITNDKGIRLLCPDRLKYRPYPEGASTSAYEYWSVQPAVRASLAKFPLCRALQPEKHGSEKYLIDLKVGLMTFGDVYDGGRILAECKSMMKTSGHISAVDKAAREMLSNTNTPLAEALWDAADYFKGGLVGPRNARHPIPIDSACQQNFVVYLTDGEPCMDEGYHGAPIWTIGNYDKDDIDEASYSDRTSGHVPPGICNRKQPGLHSKLSGGTDHLDDVAQYFYEQDLSAKFSGKQSLVTYTIGLYVDYCMLKEAAEQAGGKYYPADDSEKLKGAFAEIVTDIISRSQGGGAVAVAVVSAEEVPEYGEESKVKDKMVRARFHPGGWRGYLDAFVIPDRYEDEPNWPLLAIYEGDKDPVREDKAKKNMKLVEKYGTWKGVGWSSDNTGIHKRGAHYLLRRRTPSTRRIFTYLKKNGVMQKVEITPENINVGDTPLKTLLNAASDTEAKNLINYIKGVEPSDLEEKNWRKRFHDYCEEWQEPLFPSPFQDMGRWPLADIIFSTPIQKGAPSERYFCKDYIDFKKKYIKRERIVYVGSNCMFHAFKVDESKDDPECKDGGREIWAYIPSNLLGKLKKLTQKDYDHLYYVDLTPVIKDIKIEDKWRTVLIGGERQGGCTYFALDITGKITNEETGEAEVDYDSVKVLWEYSDKELGESWSPPQIAKANSNKEVWACFVTSGPDKEKKDAHDALYVLDAVRGELIRKISVKTGNENTWLTPPAGIDTNFDGTVDYIYAGDTQGNLWKFNLRSEKPNDWSVSKLFACGSTQPITAKPTLAYGPYYEILVNFGTGRYETIDDPPNKDQQTFYCLMDKKGGEIKKDELVDKTSNDKNESIPSGRYGWYINLTNHTKKGHFAGSERVTKEALVYRGIIIFTSFVPIDEACKAGGWAYLNAVVYSTGGKPGKVVMDVTDDMKVDEEDKITRCRALDTEAKDKEAVGVPSKPVIDERRDVILVQTSMGGRVAVIKIDPPLQKVRIRTWREL